MGDAESAKTYVRVSRPDLVILDLFVDGLNYHELLREIKNQEPSLPVIILTAYESLMDDPRLPEADAYVTKSLDFAELKQKTGDFVGGKSGFQTEEQATPHGGRSSSGDRSPASTPSLPAYQARPVFLKPSLKTR